MIEHYFDCPHCWEHQLKMIDPSVNHQNFIEYSQIGWDYLKNIEDCAGCCNPLEFYLMIEDHTLHSFSVIPIGQ